MTADDAALVRGLDALRHVVARMLLDGLEGPGVLRPGLVGHGLLGPATAGAAPTDVGRSAGLGLRDLGLLSEALAQGAGPDRYGDAVQASSSEESSAERERLIALVELARSGDADAFGLLYDHYHLSVYRFLYYRTRSVALAEDLTSETFFRALRSISTFRWQGRDFGAWLTTIARNITADHFKAGRTRLELSTEDMSLHDSATDGPESEVLASLTNQALMTALGRLTDEQRDCLVMRFLQGMSIAETAAVLGRSDGAIKQLQLRGVRNLAKLMPDDLRPDDLRPDDIRPDDIRPDDIRPDDVMPDGPDARRSEG